MNFREVLLAARIKQLENENDTLLRLAYGLCGPEPKTLDKATLEGDDIGLSLDGETVPGSVVVMRKFRHEIEAEQKAATASVTGETPDQPDPAQA